MMLDGNVQKGTNSIGDIDMIGEYKVGTSADGYVLEFSMKLMNGIPAADKAIGMEFMYNDADEAATFLNALRWNVDTAAGDTPPYMAVDNFGEVTFAEYVAPVVDEAPADEAPVDAPADEAPVTADAGVVVAAVVMAAAAAVVLSKKH